MKTLLLAALCAGAFAGLLAAADRHLSLPVVLFDAATGQCVAIESEWLDLTCSDPLPGRYISGWAAPAPEAPAIGDPWLLTAEARP